MTKQFYLIFSVLCFTFQYALAQEITFGKIPAKDLLMKVYPADTTANALIVFEKGETVIKKDQMGRPSLFFTLTRRIKILNKNGVDQANIEIPVYSAVDSKREEILKNFRAVVVNPDRTSGSISEKDVFYQDIDEHVTLAKFTLPNVQTGSVIDYTYEIRSPFLYNFRSWEFQGDLPKLHSEYHTNIPANYTYNIKLMGDLKLDHKDEKILKDCFYFQGLGSADCVLSEYRMKNIPAFREEKYMTAKPNFLSAIRYELMTFENFSRQREHYTKSWETVDKELREAAIGRQASRERYFRDFLPEDQTGTQVNVQTAKAIYYALQKQLFWDKTDHLFREIDVKTAFDKRTGSSTELNLILLNTLKAKGFNAFPMLVSTRDNGLPSREIPAITDFNVLIVKLDIADRSYLLDLTEKELSFGMIRYELLNQYGRVLDFKNGGYFYPLLPPEAYSRMSFQASIDPAAKKARVRKISSGYYAFEKRKEYSAAGSDDEYLDDIDQMLEERADFTLAHYKNQGLESLEDPFIENFEINMNRDLKEDRLFINPFILESIGKNPFQLAVRTYPVDFGYPFQVEYTIFIESGDRFQLEKKPEDLHIQLPGKNGELHYTVREMDDKVMIVLHMKIADPLIPSTQYADLKEFFNEFVRLQNKNPITLIKRSKFLSENAGK